MIFQGKPFQNVKALSQIITQILQEYSEWPQKTDQDAPKFLKITNTQPYPFYWINTKHPRHYSDNVSTESYILILFPQNKTFMELT